MFLYKSAGSWKHSCSPKPKCQLDFRYGINWRSVYVMMSKDFSTPKKVYIVVIIPVLVKGEKWVISGLLLSRSELTLELRGCISTWNSLLTHKKYVPFFLKQIVTGNEKWIVYTNVEWKRSRNKWYEPPWITSKTSLHPNKVMLYIWWDWKGVFYYELLQENQTINSSKYRSQ